jgi:hypothetical protein
MIAFRDILADGEAALQESPFFALPAEEAEFSGYYYGLVAEGGGDAPESGLEAAALAMTSPWTTRGDRRRQVIVVWTDQPAHPLNASALPPAFAGRVPADFSALTDLREDPQGPLGSSSKRRTPQRRLTQPPLTTLPSARKVADAHSWVSCSASSTSGGHDEHSLAVQRMRGGEPRRRHLRCLRGGDDTPVSRGRRRPGPRSASPDAAHPARAAPATCEAGDQPRARHRGRMALRRRAQLQDDPGTGRLHCGGHTAPPPLITLIGASGGSA